jgi:dynein heavy chain
MDITYNETYLPFFIKTNKEFEDIIRTLNSYLDNKRLYFPRFFFLSNDEILDMLGHNRDI